MTTVTVGGLPGTGTSTLCKLLQERLGTPYHYAGAIFREEAKRRGLSLGDFSALCQKDPSIDEALDDRQLFLLKRGNIIMEGRLSGWLAQRHRLNALKIWVNCDEKERLRRLVQRDGGDLETQREATWGRELSEADRYRRYYGVDLKNMAYYDLVLDSTNLTPELLAERVQFALAEISAGKT